MMIRKFTGAILLLCPYWAFAEDFRLAFGSCGHQDKAQPIWEHVLESKPDVFVFLGDNIYGDTDDMSLLAEKYQKLDAKPGFKRLRTQVEVQATWDDHDFGRDDAGREYPFKEDARRIMLDFFDEPDNSERRSRPDGLYTSRNYQVGSHSVQLILLDLRWNRSALSKLVDRKQLKDLNTKNIGPYLVNTYAGATLMGAHQQKWLAAQLKEPADVTIIGSSIQVLADFTGWEAWANFPKERDLLLALVENTKHPVLFISGDVHWAELSRMQGGEHDHVELTSSGLTEEWKKISPNKHRIGEAHAVSNFGLVDISFPNDKPVINLTVKDSKGQTLIQSLF